MPPLHSIFVSTEVLGHMDISSDCLMMLRQVTEVRPPFFIDVGCKLTYLEKQALCSTDQFWAVVLISHMTVAILLNY